MKKVIRFMSVITLSATMLLCSNATSAKAGIYDDCLIDNNNIHRATINMDSKSIVSREDLVIKSNNYRIFNNCIQSIIFESEDCENMRDCDNIYNAGTFISIGSDIAPSNGQELYDGYSLIITDLKINGVDFTKYIQPNYLGMQECRFICPDFDITIDIQYEYRYYYFNMDDVRNYRFDSTSWAIFCEQLNQKDEIYTLDLSKELPVPSQSVENIFSDIMEQQENTTTDTTTDIVEEQEQIPSEDITEQQQEDTTTDVIEEQEQIPSEDITKQQQEDTTTDIIEEQEQIPSEDITEEQPEETPVEDTTEQEPTAPVTNTSDTNNVLPIIVLLAASIISIKKIRE